MKKILVLLSLFILVGCDQSTTTTGEALDYSDFTEYMIFEADTQLSLDHYDYYLYFYQLQCGGCNAIKQEVLSKIELLESDHIYLVQVTPPGTNDIHPSIHVEYTPSLVWIVNGEVEDIFVGPEDVLTALLDIN